MAVGQDPAGDKAAGRERTADSIETIKTLYLAAQAKRLKPRSFAGVELHLEMHAKPLHALSVDKVTRRDVADLLTTLAQESGSVSANRVRSSISAMFNWAMKAGRAETNPAAFTNKENEKARERVLTDHELAKVWNALPEGDFGTIVKLLALTGLRRDEIGSLCWSEIDMKRGTITLPPARVKNNRQHIIPMSEPVRALIKAIRETPGRDFVFGYGNGAFSGWSRCKERLNAAVALRIGPCMTSAEPLPPAWAILACSCISSRPRSTTRSGHKAGVAGIYQRSLHEKEVREALTLWAAHVEKIVGARRKRERAA